MPFFDYKCDNDHVEEQLFLAGDETPRWVKCATCGENARRQLPLISRTANRWGETNGYYSPNLGAHVRNSQHRDQIMKEKGLVDLRDCDQHFVEDRIEKEMRQHDQHKKNVQEYHDHMSGGDSRGDALAKTFSVSKLKEQGLIASDIRGE